MKYLVVPVALTLLAWSAVAWGADEAARPNVLMFIALDDLNDWIGCMGGNPQSVTPNLDRLAAGGMLFTNAACTACHSTGAAGAPKYGDVAAWAPRIAKGIDALHQSGINGLPGTGMIAKGGCMNCSDEEVIAAVDYMVEGSQ